MFALGDYAYSPQFEGAQFAMPQTTQYDVHYNDFRLDPIAVHSIAQAAGIEPPPYYAHAPPPYYAYAPPPYSQSPHPQYTQPQQFSQPQQYSQPQQVQPQDTRA